MGTLFNGCCLCEEEAAQIFASGGLITLGEGLQPWPRPAGLCDRLWTWTWSWFSIFSELGSTLSSPLPANPNPKVNNSTIHLLSSFSFFFRFFLLRHLRSTSCSSISAGSRWKSSFTFCRSRREQRDKSGHRDIATICKTGKRVCSERIWGGRVAGATSGGREGGGSGSHHHRADFQAQP